MGFFIDFQWFSKGFGGFDKAKKDLKTLWKGFYEGEMRKNMKMRDFDGEKESKNEG